MIALLLSLSVVVAEPDPATLVYYNARLALRANKPREALRFWLLRNTLESETGALSEHDEDFRSLTWVALGDLGLCPDGLEPGSAGLWPVALHNWFIRNMRRGDPPDEPSPFDAFDIPQQRRFVALDDVLNVVELNNVRFHRTSCYRMKDVLVAAGLSSSADPVERKNQVRVLRYLLSAAQITASDERVKGKSTLGARLMDIQLKSMDLEDRSSRREYREERRRTKALGGVVAPPEDVARTPGVRSVLKPAAQWSADDWLALESERRLFLYDWLRRAELATETTRLDVIDQLIERQDGRELATWIAFGGASSKEIIWSGDRGQRLLSLERETGFRERAAIALHRGVDNVGRGLLAEALRSFAYALHFADESTDAESVRRLSLRWLSFVAGQFAVTDELVTMLVELVPRGDLSQILEGLVWDAAFGADATSFERTVAAHRGRGALQRRVERLRPLANGDIGAFLTALRTELDDAPHATMRFIRRFLERLETQNGDVRANHRRTLRQLRELLLARVEKFEGGLARRARELEGVTAALLEGIPDGGPEESARDRARALSPAKEVYAGSIRLAPSDPLPWPFDVPGLRPPSVFKPLPITPVEWRSTDGLVMGWKLGQ